MKPYDVAVLTDLLQTHRTLLIVEEGAVMNGFGAFMSRELHGVEGGAGVRVECMGIPDRFVVHGSRGQLLRDLELDVQGIETRLRTMVVARPEAEARETA
jgi:1-deoxy-D-xylulose-5-phosphate synthase